MAQVQWGELLKNPAVKNAAIGVGLAVVVPVTIAAVAPLIRPLARSTIKVGLLAYERSREVVAELGEVLDDLVAEVREELRAEREAVELELQETISEAEGHAEKGEGSASDPR